MLGQDAVKYVITEVIMPILLVVGSFVDDSVQDIIEGFENEAPEQIQYSQEQLKVESKTQSSFKPNMGG